MEIRVVEQTLLFVSAAVTQRSNNNNNNNNSHYYYNKNEKMSGKRKAKSQGSDESDEDDSVKPKSDFWEDLNFEMNNFPSRADPDTFWTHFQNKVPLPDPPEFLIASSTASSTAVATLPDQALPASSSGDSAAAAPKLGGEPVNKERINLLVETDDNIIDVSLEEYEAAIEKIKEILEKRKNQLLGWWLDKKRKSKYENRLSRLHMAMMIEKIRKDKDAEIEKIRKENKKEKEDKDAEIEKIRKENKKEKERDRIKTWVDLTTRQKRVVCLQLQALGNLSTETKKTVAQHTIAARREKKKLKTVYERPKEDQVAEQLEPNEARNKLVKNYSGFEEFKGLTFQSVVLDGEMNVVPNLEAVAKIYETLFRNACFLRREDDRDGNAEFYEKLMQPAVAVLEKAATNIREGTMPDKLGALVQEIESQNTDRDLVKVVERLQQLRSWFQDSERKNDTIESPHTKYQDIFDSITKQKNSKDAVKVINKHLETLMPNLMWLPGPTAQEVHGCQVVFGALLRAIAECLPNSAPASDAPSETHSGGSNSAPSSDAPSETHSGGNRNTPLKGTNFDERKSAKTSERPDRFVDFTLFKRGRYRVCLHDDIFEVCIEIKPYQRLVSGPNACQNEALNQGLSHGGKALYNAVKLGPGFPAHAIFIVGTVLNVTVYKLVFTDPGTPDAELKLEASEYLPLLPRECYERYVGSDKRHEDDDENFVNLLYPQQSGNMNATNQQTGIPALAKVMRSSQGTLIRLDHPSLKFAQLLGSGSFGLVLDVGDGEVSKISCYGNFRDFKHEVAILKYLAQHKEDDDAARVVSLERYGMFEIPYRGISVKLPGLVMSPKGYQLDAMDPKLLSQVASDLLCGLDWLHGLGIAHNDISDTNFVLVNNRAVITDLALAVHLNTVMFLFVGTPDFSHPDIHLSASGSWVARAEYDIAALAHTLCTLGNGGKTPWSPIAKPCKDKRKLEDRNEKTMGWLDRAVLDDGTRSRLKDCVGFSLPFRKCTGTNCANAECARCQCIVCTDACPYLGNCNKGHKPALRIDLDEIVFDGPLKMGTLDENN